MIYHKWHRFNSAGFNTWVDILNMQSKATLDNVGEASKDYSLTDATEYTRHQEAQMLQVCKLH